MLLLSSLSGETFANVHELRHFDSYANELFFVTFFILLYSFLFSFFHNKNYFKLKMTFHVILMELYTIFRSFNQINLTE